MSVSSKSITEEQVILVDENDNPIGLMPKLEAHSKGRLHRAFSVFVLNHKGELMLQKRASHKYHSPDLWTNTCCSHQREGESSEEAGRRRLQEEMGFTTPLKRTTSFIYKVSFDNGLTEHEYDHILVGSYEKAPNINKDEVSDWKWMSLDEIHHSLHESPDMYTAWFKIIFEKFYKFILV